LNQVVLNFYFIIILIIKMEIFNIQNTNSDKSPSFLKELINSGVH
jgi:hypothetical protein